MTDDIVEMNIGVELMFLLDGGAGDNVVTLLALSERDEGLRAS